MKPTKDISQADDEKKESHPKKVKKEFKVNKDPQSHEEKELELQM